MLKENISLSQLLTLIINFLLGSAIVVGVGLDAKEDAWLAVLLATFIGLIIIYLHYYMASLLPGKNLFEIFEYCFKRPIAILLTLGYITYFLNISARVIRDFGELITTAILPLTPMELINLSICLLIAYILYLGLEILGRTAEIFTPYMIVLIILLFIFLFASGNRDLNNLQPLLGEGFKLIGKALFPTLLTFPFGEVVIFLVIFSSVTNFKYSKFICLASVLIAGMLLTLSMVIMITAVGVDIMQRSNFPLLSAARQVSIGDFLERIDAIVVFIMMLGILTKSSVFIYGGLKGLEYIFKIPYRDFALPVLMIVSLFSLLIAENFADHIEEGIKIVPYYLHQPMEFLIPGLTLATLLLKRKRKGKGKGDSNGNEVKL